MDEGSVDLLYPKLKGRGQSSENSILQPDKRLNNLKRTMREGFDVRNWRMFHNYHQKGRFALPVALALGNFVFLIFILSRLVSLFARWLAQGIWINPAPMFIGLFIHSYMAAATATGQWSACGIHASGGFTSFLYKLIGIPGCYASVWDCLCRWSLKVGICWITVGMAISILWTHR